MKYETTYRISKECKLDSNIILTFLNPMKIEEPEKIKYVNLLKFKFKSEKTIILEDLEFQLEKCFNEKLIKQKYIGKIIDALYVIFIYYCKIDLNYHHKINDIHIELNRKVEIIKVIDPNWIFAHKLLNYNE